MKLLDQKQDALKDSDESAWSFIESHSIMMRDGDSCQRRLSIASFESVDEQIRHPFENDLYTTRPYQNNFRYLASRGTRNFLPENTEPTDQTNNQTADTTYEREPQQILHGGEQESSETDISKSILMSQVLSSERKKYDTHCISKTPSRRQVKAILLGDGHAGKTALAIRVSPTTPITK